MTRTILAISILGLLGLALTGPHLSAWTGWMPLARQMGAQAAHHAPLWRTVAGLALCLIGAWRRWRPEVIIACGLAASPMWWPHYWLAVWLAVAGAVGSVAKGKE